MFSPQTKVSDPWGNLVDMQCRLSCELQLPNLTVEDILQLAPGSVLATGWKTNQDVPFYVNRKLLGWVEFETSDKRLSIRVTEFVWEHKA